MPDNPNTAFEIAQVDIGDWEIAFKPYSEDADAALTLACNLMIIRAYLVEPANIESVIESLEEAMHALYPYTLFHKISFVLFRRLAEGKIDLELEATLKKLGIRF